jgi:flagellar hook-length control protein FliK
MTSLAPIDLHTQLAAAAEPPSRATNEARSTHEESGGFAETLQRRTSADEAAKRANVPAESKELEKPTKAPTGATKDSPAEKPAKPTDGEPTGETSEAPDTVAVAQPLNDQLPDPSLPVLLDAPIAVPSADPAAPTDATELTLPILAPAAPGTDSSIVKAVAHTVADVLADSAPVLDGLSKPAAVTTAEATVVDAATPVIKPTTSVGAEPAAPVTGEAITTVVASTPAVTATAPAAPVVAADDKRTVNTVVSSTPAAATEVQADAALPPVTDAESAAPVALALAGAGMMSVEKSEAPAASAPLAAQPLNTATPATQSSAMHAVASTLGAKEKPVVEETTASANPSGKLVGEAPTTLAAPAATTPVVTQTRPLSEAVLAQATLAANGNAMEKVVSHQVSKALVQNLPNGDKMMVLRLTPPELGTVKIEVIERQGVLSARLHAEDDGVRLALERFLPSMRQDLRAHDAPIRELTLSDQAQFQRSFADGQQQQQQDTNRSSNRREREDTPRFSVDGIRSEPVAVPRSAPLGGRVGVSGVDARA